MIGSIRLGSSPLPGLLTRRDTGHMRSASSGADFSSSVPPGIYGRQLRRFLRQTFAVAHDAIFDLACLVAARWVG